jgi:single-strand DNA-binding protein
MARGVNKVILIGNLGMDPDTSYLPSGAAVTKFSIAVTETWKDKTTGEQKESTEWIDIEAWGGVAEACAKYLQKGSPVYVEGRWRTDKWQDKETGQNRYRTKVRADQVQFLSNKQERGPSAPPRDSSDTQQKEFDDDIPF